MTENEAIESIVQIPVDREDQYMVLAAIRTGDWSAVESYLAFRVDSGKNLDRTILLARAWAWHWGTIRADPLLRKIAAAVQQHGRPVAC